MTLKMISILMIAVAVATGPVRASDRGSDILAAASRLEECAVNGARDCSRGFTEERDKVAVALTAGWVPEPRVPVPVRERGCESLRKSGGMPRQLPSGEAFVACD